MLGLPVCTPRMVPCSVKTQIWASALPSDLQPQPQPQRSTLLPPTPYGKPSMNSARGCLSMTWRLYSKLDIHIQGSSREMLEVAEATDEANAAQRGSGGRNKAGRTSPPLFETGSDAVAQASPGSANYCSSQLSGFNFQRAGIPGMSHHTQLI